MEEQESYIGYKIDTKHTYKVYRSEVNGKIFFKVQVTKKNYDGTNQKFYKQLRFVKCQPPQNGEIIKIKKAFEDLYTNQKDPYNAISVIVVQEYELVQGNEDPFDEYQQALNDNDMVDITGDDFLD
jgi:hypothetical protein